MKKRLLNKKFFLIYLIVGALIINTLQFPYILSNASDSWKSIDEYESSSIIKTALSNTDDSLTKTHNFHLTIGENFPNSIIITERGEDTINATFKSHILGLGKVIELKKRDINESYLIDKIAEQSPRFEGITWLSPGHSRSGLPGIDWKIYTKGQKSSEFILVIKDNDWLLINKSLFSEKELGNVCNDC